MKFRMILTVLTVMFVMPAQKINAETVYLTSLAWPPYSEPKLAEQGASVAVAKAAFAEMGHELVVDFFPWTRAVKLAEDPKSKYIGYMPEYLYESDTFVFSSPMGTGPLGLVESTDKPISWASYDDLSQYTIGVVQDYVNTEELDERIASGAISSQTVTSDDKNLLKVAAGRIDAAVIDANVFKYLVENQPGLSKVANKLQMNEKLLVEKELYIAFKNTPEGQKWLSIFNQGLSKVDIEAVMTEYLNR
ncbi:ABC transporter [Alteromonas sediminis]|uniref:ABC transporter n=1 Tax=Alteromonas sediminis TaxID=2259342 RepID=A0A3N5Y2U2_9ALTE|nr:transporter substrate-binding domain-containing protein [Alteromonas sediminis]RPJ68112.1 ABC transporter [Alteromonas sediminis]